MIIMKEIENNKPFGLLVVGDTFKAPDGNYYLKVGKIFTPAMSCDTSADGPFNAVCFRDACLKFVDEKQPVTPVDLEVTVIRR